MTMTKEAKIGLLLGLLFIIGIAVVLRGMHRNSQATLDKEKELLADAASAMEMTDSTSQAIPLTATTQVTDTDTALSEKPAEATATDAASPAEEAKASNSAPAATASETVAPSANSAPANAASDAGKIRHVQELPGGSEKWQIVPPSGAIDRAAINVTEPTKAEKMLASAGQMAGPGPSKVYEVKSGDDLTRVSLNVYGSEQGKKPTNIDRIYEANKSTMKSRDSLKVGQKLTIPSLPTEFASAKAATSPSTTAMPSAKPTSAAAAPAKTEKTVNYTIKEGDSFWKIAKEKLGSGSRYKEILKLNGLKDETSLKTGMTLKLPNS
jgi:nucleoid-associated protein YgaU